MKRASLILLCAGMLAAAGGSNHDHLQPAFSTAFGPTDYPHRVRELLLAGGDDRTLAAFAMSSEGEWAVLLHPAIDGHARLELRIADSSIWEALKDGTPPPGFTSHVESLGIETEKAITKVWERFLLATGDPYPGGLDGTMYEFALYGPRPMSGSVYSSPNPWCMQTGKLIDLLSSLRRYALLPHPGQPSPDRTTLRALEEGIREKAAVLNDASRLEASITECKAHEAAVETTEEDIRRVEDRLEHQAIVHYCACGRWPASAEDLRHFHESGMARARRDDPDAKTSLRDVDFEGARTSVDRWGQLLLSVPRGYPKEIAVPECLDLTVSSWVSALCPDPASKR